MLKNGYWFDLEDQSWTQLRFPTYAPFFGAEFYHPNTIHSLWGKPTIFGNSNNCDVTGKCDNKEIIQYDVDDDNWEVIGVMRESRTLHDVIEIPDSICDKIKPTPVEPADENSAALIIGGYRDVLSNGANLVTSVEIFGCDDHETSQSLDNYPYGIYLSSSVYYEGKVLTCGGFTTGSSTSRITNLCHELSPEEGEWLRSPSDLNNAKQAGIMALVRDLDVLNSVETVPAILGSNLITEIYQPLTRNWREYKPLVDEDWNSYGCLIQHGDKIYNIKDSVMELDTTVWKVKQIGEVPMFLREPGMCSIAEHQGKTGKQNYFIFCST